MQPSDDDRPEKARAAREVGCDFVPQHRPARLGGREEFERVRPADSNLRIEAESEATSGLILGHQVANRAVPAGSTNRKSTIQDHGRPTIGGPQLAIGLGDASHFPGKPVRIATDLAGVHIANHGDLHTGPYCLSVR